MQDYRFDPILPSDPAVELQPEKASRDGKIGISFNQPLLVPPFTSKKEIEKGRAMFSTAELNATRDVFDF